MVHHFTVDVEEYFNYLGFERRVPLSSWSTLESRVEKSVLTLLAWLDEADSRGTFFTLGWIAERHPDLVRDIAREGHELASHGYSHRRVVELTPEDFREEVRFTKALIENLVGQEVVGFRAPHFSLLPGCEWALDVLIEEGYTYDSSLFPIRRKGYGYPDGGRDPYWLERPAGGLVEVPPATVSLAGKTLPAGGGAWFRVFPYGLVRRALVECEARDVPGTFYIHPWEIDPDQPVLEAPWLDRWKHHAGLARTEERLLRLLEEFRFSPISETVTTFTEGCRPGSDA